jgi:hypothetical protein
VNNLNIKNMKSLLTPTFPVILIWVICLPLMSSRHETDKALQTVPGSGPHKDTIQVAGHPDFTMVQSQAAEPPSLALLKTHSSGGRILFFDNVRQCGINRNETGT